uniref:Chromo domain-containing protein n=1 Tax=Calcidiscus leptoporus TaxID=127549 RepID=A0A7S0J6V1_9EUKA|mmetsp:Transcript_40931/g.95592  ORF Transcript_40931/g.95592 Transcript_40931/m.95592 type:complete len:576 (+) Transcript_40931:155-1882(+)|eukprot:CAMPEP_0119352570 /NCGR_PEP_ID=MMETSP1334-20130426/1840_1 /TAXON_ID=127549 /ORGANISM="Calcidiscus leptoporus, Strain RCC1130" /LENGTH=575 /DNA_ID=CAMNT_0007365655 /DNA_START=155 /DNA_END=1882 /DNA_ORIENTATION=-
MTVENLPEARPGVVLCEPEPRNGKDPEHEPDAFVVKIREAAEPATLPLKPVPEPASPDDICTLEGEDEASETIADDGRPPEPVPEHHVLFNKVRLKMKGVGDETYRSNVFIREAIVCLAQLLQRWPALQLRVADCGTELNEALKLYRDMNHLSLAGGITCEQVLHHVQSHTVLLYYRASKSDPQLAVTAATFSMRGTTMMLRLLATHPRMTRKGFARVTVHFLKELCRALHKTEILVYTYPSSAPFYKAMHFRHTRTELLKPVVCAPAAASSASAEEMAAAQLQARQEAREARRVFSAQENEMIYHVQLALEQVVDVGFKQEATVHPYACTRRRASQPPPALRPARSKALAGAEHASGTSRRADRRGGRSGMRTDPPTVPPADPQASRCSSCSLTASCSSSASSSSAAAWCAAVSPLYTSPQVTRSDCKNKSAAPGLPTVGDVVASTPACRTSSADKRAAHEHELASDADAARPMDSDDAGGAEASADDEHVEDDDDGHDSAPQRKRKFSKGEYDVENIVGVRSCSGEVQYCVKWAGWAPKFNTWEPASNLINLQSEIDAFESALKSARTCPLPS